MNVNKQLDCSRCQNLCWQSIYYELIEAIERRDVPTVSHILNCSYKLSTAKHDAQPLIHRAFKDNNGVLELRPLIIQILKLLLDKGANVNARDHEGLTVLHLAVEEQMIQVINFLLNHKADIYVVDSSGNSLLHFFIKADYYKIKNFNRVLIQGNALQTHQKRSANFVKWMLVKNLDVDRKNANGDTAFHLAATHNLLHVLPILLNQSRDMTVCNKRDVTAFQMFIESNTADEIINVTKPHIINNSFLWSLRAKPMDPPGHSLPSEDYPKDYIDEIFMLFLEGGFSKTYVDNFGNTLVHYALKLDRLRLATSMLKHLKDVNAQDNHGNTPLHLIMYLYKSKCGPEQRKYKEIVRVLWLKGADINIINNRGLSPLTIAVESKRDSLIKMFLEYSSEFNLCFRDNLLLHFFNLKKMNNLTNNMVVINRIIGQGWDINGRDKLGMTLLHIAVQLENNNEDLVEALIKRGAKVDIMDMNGCLPLHMAIAHKNERVIKKLFKFGADINDNVHILSIDAYKVANRTCLDSHAFRVTSMRNYYNPPYNVIVSHLIRLHVAGLPVADELQCLIPEEASFTMIYQQCLVEIEKLKICRTTDYSVSLYNLLRNNCNYSRAYLKNKKLKKLMTSPIFDRKFMSYHELLFAAHQRGIQRREMMEQVGDALNSLTKFRLPDLCLREIFSYLSNANLRSIIEGAKIL